MDTERKWWEKRDEPRNLHERDTEGNGGKRGINPEICMKGSYDCERLRAL